MRVVQELIGGAERLTVRLVEARKGNKLQQQQNSPKVHQQTNSLVANGAATVTSYLCSSVSGVVQREGQEKERGQQQQQQSATTTTTTGVYC